MHLSLFDYHLPEELIAARPAERRDESRLMHLPAQGAPRHLVFRDMLSLLRAGDVLVLNDSRVIPARLEGTRGGTTGRVEALLLEPVPGAQPVWRALVRPGRKLIPGARMVFAPGEFEAEVTGIGEEGTRVLRFDCEPAAFDALLERHGLMPLPPYILKARGGNPAFTDGQDRERYQTVYAAQPGSIAAPTAGLHFTRELLAEAEARGIETVRVTLHVGAGTFRPVAVEDITQHPMHTESYHVSEAAAEQVNRARREGRRIVAVGTTATRTLESSAAGTGAVRPGHGATKLMIYPGYQWRVVDALITNFHLPKSTLLMLVSAFAGRERILAAYAEAIRERYRFFSYGDATFLERAAQ
jgi:S-adenosylmethionine:tRNA ribosyltransferase-isomerase